MIKTLPIKEIEEHADNVYEAAVIISKRARQINAEQKQVLMRERGFDDEYDSFDEDEFNPEEIDMDFLTLPKPADLAIEEFREGKVVCKYQEEEPENANPANNN